MNNPTQPKQLPLNLVVQGADCAALGLTGIQKSVLLALIFHYNPRRNGTEVWPSIDLISAEVGYSPSSVKRALFEIADRRYIKTRHHQGYPNRYSLNVDLIRDSCTAAKVIHRQVRVTYPKGGGGVRVTYPPGQSDLPPQVRVTPEPLSKPLINFKGSVPSIHPYRDLEANMEKTGTFKRLKIVKNPKPPEN